MATTGTLTTLYYLLKARYGGSHIKSDNPTQWKLKIMSTVFMYAPTWSKRLELQDKVRQMSDEEIQKGSIATYNSAQNPDGAPTTETWDTLPGINSQNKTLQKRGKLEAYAMVDSILRTDVTKELLDRFAPYFDKVASPQRPLIYDLSNTFPEGDLTNLPVYGDTNVPLFGNYITNTLDDMFPAVDSFITVYQTCGIPTTIPVA